MPVPMVNFPGLFVDEDDEDRAFRKNLDYAARELRYPPPTFAGGYMPGYFSPVIRIRFFRRNGDVLDTIVGTSNHNASVPFYQQATFAHFLVTKLGDHGVISLTPDVIDLGFNFLGGRASKFILSRLEYCDVVTKMDAFAGNLLAVTIRPCWTPCDRLEQQTGLGYPP